MRITKWALAAIPFILLTSCNYKKKIGAADDHSKRTVFFDKAGMDTTIKPGDNFFYMPTVHG